MYYPKLLSNYIDLLPVFYDSIISNDYNSFSLDIFFYDYPDKVKINLMYEKLVKYYGKVENNEATEIKMFSDFKDTIRICKVREITARIKNNQV
jgi:hypothetical protein